MLQRCTTISWVLSRTDFPFSNILKRWSFQKNRTGIWSFLYYQERWYFFFPKIWSYSLDTKGKTIFLKKILEIWYFLQMFWKRWSFQKIHAWINSNSKIPEMEYCLCLKYEMTYRPDSRNLLIRVNSWKGN